ncbi:MAG: hypothetical protein Q4Q23_01880 [Methanobacteriaceae archaeon]|nr:hypothetical protein [Methanobacteriaceae archaeon]
MKIAIVAETAPVKTIIPIIENINAKIISLTHDIGSYQLLEPYSEKIQPIGQGRKGQTKRSNFTIARLVLQDTLRTMNALKKQEDIDLVLTCGNAGDARKGILTSKLLHIPCLHIEQDIYNPTEMLAFANLITVPNKQHEKIIKKNYGIKNTINIKGYPQAKYVSQAILEPEEEVFKQYNTNDFYVLVLGGDTKTKDIKSIIREVEQLNKTILIIPFRFNPEYVRQFIRKENIFIITEFVDLLSLMRASQGVIYSAGMGITIEVGALNIPAIKILGFHKKHASIDLARSLGINVINIHQLTEAINIMKPTNGKQLIQNGDKASKKVAEIITNFQLFNGKNGGITSMKKIWDERKQYR